MGATAQTPDPKPPNQATATDATAQTPDPKPPNQATVTDATAQTPDPKPPNQAGMRCHGKGYARDGNTQARMASSTHAHEASTQGISSTHATSTTSARQLHRPRLCAARRCSRADD